MNGFREAVHDRELVDLGFIGSEYTWIDNRDDEVRFGIRWLAPLGNLAYFGLRRCGYKRAVVKRRLQRLKMCSGGVHH
ncbi:hypothetical protein ACFX1R_027165 [Malus domestica]